MDGWVCACVRRAACKHNTDWTVPARTVKFGIHTSYDKRTTPICFQGQVSKFKVKRYTLLLNLVNIIQTEPFKLGPSNVVCTYGKRTTPICFQGQGSKFMVKRYTLLLNLVNIIQTEPFKLGPSNLVHILLMARGRHLLVFKVMGQRSRSHVRHFLNLANAIKTDSFGLGLSGTILVMARGQHLLLFKVNVKVNFGCLAMGCHA